MQSSTSAAGWTQALAESAVAPGSARTWKNASAQLVIGRTHSGEFFALDNRCPHEGYPLAQGNLKDTVLTCCWHNWKFDVRNGACLFGGEDVRRYPVRVIDGHVQVDLTPPPRRQERQRLRHSLADAITHADLERALRDALRLLHIDTPVERILGDVALHDSLHAEYGATHVLALAADTRRLLPVDPDADPAVFLAPLLELACETNQRLPRRPVPSAVTPGAQAPSLDVLRRHVEAENIETAQAVLRAAHAAGHGRHSIEQWLFALCSEHFLSFGHALIYLVKAGELLDALDLLDVPDDDDAVDDVVSSHMSLLLHMLRARREDTLPYLRNYFGPVRGWENDFPRVWESARQGKRQGLPRPVQDAVLHGKRAAAVQSVWDALLEGWTPGQVAGALVLAAAQRLLRFDESLDRDVTVQEGWLYATHRLTFASAVRHAVERFDSPHALRFLFQAAAFIHSGAPMDDPQVEEPRADAASSVSEIRAAILARDPQSALRRLAAWLRAEEPSPQLIDMLQRVAVEAQLVRPIFRVHAIKTMLAGIEETLALGNDPQRALPVLAAVRFVAAPVQERRTESAAHAAAEWVQHGRMIRKLTQ